MTRARRPRARRPRARWPHAWSTSAAVLLAATLVGGCQYVVVPPEESQGVAVSTDGWTAVPTAIATTETGDLRIDLAIQNGTGHWSAMTAVEGQPATLTAGGQSTDCTTVLVGTGGHRLAPGFRMRGFTGGTKTKPEIESIRVECAGATAPTGDASLKIPISFVTGDYDYFDPDATKVDTTMDVPLTEVATDVTYPVATPVDGLIQAPDAPITAINDVVLTLTGTSRAGGAIESSWTTSNAGEYPSSVHIGEPPVIGSDGILYGYWRSPDLASVPITKPAGTAEWTTSVKVPDDVTDLVMLLSVETGRQRLFANYALDLSGS